MDELVSDFVPEVIHPDQNLILYKYYETYKFQYLIDSFNKFVNHDLAACLEAHPIDLPDGSIATIKLMRVYSPEYEIDGVYYPLSHTTAILEGKSFAGRVVVKIELTSKSTKKSDKRIKTITTISDQEHTLFNLPIMVYSDKDPGRNVLLQNKEPTDPGCYFIVNGIRNIVLLFEKARQNQIMIHIDKDNTMQPYVTQLTENAASTFQMVVSVNHVGKRKIIGSRFNKWEYNKPTEDKKEDNSENEKKKDFTDTVNVVGVCFLLNWFLGKKQKSADEIKNKFIKILKQIIPKEQYFKCYSVFTTTLTDYEAKSKRALKNFTQEVALILDIVSLPQEEIEYIIKQYFFKRFFPLWDTSSQKINMIITMTARQLQCMTGAIKPTNQGHWGTRALSAPGEMLLEVLRRKLNGVIKKVKKIIPKQFSATNPITANGILEIVTNQDLDSKFMAEFKGLPSKKNKGPGAPKQQSKQVKAIAMDAVPINGLDLVSMLTKTRNNANEDSTNFKIRELERSTFYFMCSYKFTENGKCGMTKFIASTTIITIGQDSRPVIDVLLRKKIKKKYLVKKKYNQEYNKPVNVNGLLIGYTNSVFGYSNLVLLKRYGIIPHQSCIVDAAHGAIEIFVDSRRLMVPVLVIDPLTEQPSMYKNEYWKSMSFVQLLKHGYAEWLDNYEIENPTTHLAQSFYSNQNYKIELKKLELLLEDALLQNKNKDYIYNIKREINSILSNKPNRVVIHPIAAYGTTPALIKYSNSQMTCRTSFADKQTNQKIALPFASPFEHVETYNALYGTSPLVSTGAFRLTGLDEQQAGETMTVMFLSDESNQEDSSLVSKAAIDRGLMRYVKTIILKETLKTKDQHFGHLNVSNVHPHRLRHIGVNGMPAIGVKYDPGDCIVGKYEQNEDGTVSDRSRYLERDECGVIVEYITYLSSKSNKSLSHQETVSVKIELYSRTDAGNKITTDHAQKYIISKIVNGEEMFYVIDSGKVADVVLNPLCIGTRMTTGSLAELAVGRVAALTGKSVDVGGHTPQNNLELFRILREYGFNSDGTQRVRDPRSGRVLKAQVFTGPCRVNILAHIAAYKIQCRGGKDTSKKDPLTGQAVASITGSSRDKGQKVSEYEAIQFIKYGARFLASERMNLSCDGEVVVICKICSSYASYDPVQNKFKCNICLTSGSDQTCSERFGKYIEPKTKKYITHLLSGMGIREKVSYMSKEEYLKSNLVVDEDQIVNVR